MADYNINLTVQSIWSIVRMAIDIGVMWFILYYAIKFVKNNNRTIQIFKGIIIVLVLNGISKILGLTTIEYITNMVISWGFLAIIIIFQPEIRGVLERIGKTNAFSRVSTLLANEKEDLVEQVYEATITLSKSRTGALISIEQSQSLQDYIKTGIEINAKVSKELLSSIFMTTTPLHDGAVIIQGDKVVCASAYFPPTSVNLSSRYGARHRAALGISEVTDALTIVVSEETSAISIAEHGTIFTVDEKQLKDYLRRVIMNEDIEITDQSKNRSSLSISDEPEMIIEKVSDENKEPLFKHFFKSNISINKKDAEEIAVGEKEPDMKVPLNNRLKYQNANMQPKPETKEVPKAEAEEDIIEIKDNSQKEDK